MATISNTMSINDGMSPALNSIAAALAGCTAAFQQMQHVSGQAIDTANIHEANRVLQQTEAQQDAVNQSLHEGSNAADRLWGKIKGFIAAYAGWNVVKQMVMWSDEMTNIQARVAMINDGTRTTEQLMAAIYQSAQNSHASFQSMADLVGRLGNNAREAFSSNDELLAFAEQLNKQFSISGAGAQEAQNATIQLIQGLSAGALRGEELNSVFEQAPTIIRTISEYLGVGIGEIRQLASEGKLTADVVKNALLGAAEETNAAFNAVPLTFGVAWTMVKNTAQMNMLGLQKVISDTFNTGEFQAIMDNLTAAFSNFIQFVTVGVKGTVATVNFLYENWSLIAPVIGTVVGAMAAYKSVVIATNSVEAISRGLKIAGVIASYAKAAATGVEVSATTAATAAQMGLNAAMLASPVTWIIAAIIAIIGALYLAVAIINRVTGETYSATGIIAGTIWSLWAYIKNIIATAWNTILSLAEFFMNVWNHPVYSIQKLLYNLLNVFLSMYESILQGIDPVVTGLAKGFMWAVNQGVKALNWLSSALDEVGLGWGQIGEMTMEGTVAQNFGAQKNALLAAVNPGASPEGYTSLDKYKMDFADPQKYFAEGYNAGANFAEDPLGAIKGALGLGSDPAIQEMLNNQQKQLGATEQVANNTAAKGEDDYKYLKEVMLGRAVDRLSGTDIKIDMTNNNAINSALDIDVIVDTLTSKLTAAMDSAGEGVHV